MTGLYSETQDDSSADLPQDTESESLPSTITVTTNYDLVQNAQSVTVSTTFTNPAITTTSITSTVAPDTVIKCHSRQPSASIMDREKALHNDDIVDDEYSKDCGILSCRPARVQKLARIKVCVIIHPQIHKHHVHHNFFVYFFCRFLFSFFQCSLHCNKL